MPTLSAALLSSYACGYGSGSGSKLDLSEGVTLQVASCLLPSDVVMCGCVIVQVAAPALSTPGLISHNPIKHLANAIMQKPLTLCKIRKESISISRSTLCPSSFTWPSVFSYITP